MAAHKTEEPDDRRRSFENAIQTAREGSEAYRARFKTSFLIGKVIYASSHPDQVSEGHAVMMYRTRSDHAYHGLQRQTMPPPWIFGPIGDYRCDCLRWVEKAMQRKGHSFYQNIFCLQLYVHGHSSLDCRLPYGCWKEAIANVKSFMLTEQLQVLWNAMKIAVIVSDETGVQTNSAIQQVATSISIIVKSRNLHVLPIDLAGTLEMT